MMQACTSTHLHLWEWKPCPKDASTFVGKANWGGMQVRYVVTMVTVGEGSNKLPNNVVYKHHQTYIHVEHHVLFVTLLDSFDSSSVSLQMVPSYLAVCFTRCLCLNPTRQLPFTAANAFSSLPSTVTLTRARQRILPSFTIALHFLFLSKSSHNC